MVPRGHWTQAAIKGLWDHENKKRKEELESKEEILEAKYKKTDLQETANSLKHLTSDEQELVLEDLKKHEVAFQGTGGNWNGKLFELELKEGAKPFYGKPFRIPQAYKTLVKKEVERLESIGLLIRVSGSEWAAPSFVIPKKDKTIRFLTDFRGLNRCLKRKPRPLPLIKEILKSLGASTRATTIYLNMGYYAMPLSAKSKTYCVISLPWGLYQYNMLPMGILVAADIFQEAMGGLFWTSKV